MRKMLSMTLGLAVAMVLVVGLRAADDKEVTLKGTVTCAKCDLKKEKVCTTVIVVKGGDDKETVYYFDKASGKKHHGEICQEPKKGTVKGTVKKEGDKMVVTVTDLKYD
jgi:hypothetical protein